MKATLLLALALLPMQSALAQSQAGDARDTGLETRVEARRTEIGLHVRPEAQKKIAGSVRGMMERIRSGHAGDLAETARGQARMGFRGLKPQQADLVAFLILAGTARALRNPAQMDEAVRVDFQIDSLQSQEMAQALQKDSALMSALAAMLTWTASLDGQLIAKLK